jgi:hypothetical protein
MTDQFFERPILNSPYLSPAQHWELDSDGQPTNRIVATRRRSELITPVPKPKKRRQGRGQTQMVFDAGDDLSSEEQEYNPTPIINEVRTYVETWRNLPNPDQWLVTPETARLLTHWRSHKFSDTVAHLEDLRSSTILFHLARHLLYNKYRDPGEEPKLHLFGQLKRITRQWLDGGYLKCSGGTFPAQLVYKEIADMAAERIKAAPTPPLPRQGGGGK